MNAACPCYHTCLSEAALRIRARNFSKQTCSQPIGRQISAVHVGETTAIVACGSGARAKWCAGLQQISSGSWRRRAYRRGGFFVRGHDEVGSSPDYRHVFHSHFQVGGGVSRCCSTACFLLERNLNAGGEGPNEAHDESEFGGGVGPQRNFDSCTELPPVKFEV